MKIMYYCILAIPVASFAIYIFIKRQRNRKRWEKLDYSAEGKNIALSITKCKALYKQLTKSIHPDKFNEDEKQFADELMQRINSSKYDYQQLNNLKAEVETFLNKRDESYK